VAANCRKKGVERDERKTGPTWDRPLCGARAMNAASKLWQLLRGVGTNGAAGAASLIAASGPGAADHPGPISGALGLRVAGLWRGRLRPR
jgi:hypothetical protein